MEVAFNFLDRSKRHSRKYEIRKIHESVDDIDTILRQLDEKLKTIDDETYTELARFIDRYEFDKKYELFKADEIFELSEKLHIFRNLLQAWKKFHIESRDRLPSVDGEKIGLVWGAHRICEDFHGPELKTTPGSDFSNFAVLLFELAGGEQESDKTNLPLSGAINRYARSSYRKAIEIYAHVEEEDLDLDWAIGRRLRRKIENLQAAMNQMDNSNLSHSMLESALDQEKAIYKETQGIIMGWRHN